MTMFYMIFGPRAPRKAWKLYCTLYISVINRKLESDFLFIFLLFFSFFVIQKWTVVGNGITIDRRKKNKHMIGICKSDLILVELVDLKLLTGHINMQCLHSCFNRLIFHTL
jgi:hypothetical protein